MLLSIVAGIVFHALAGAGVVCYVVGAGIAFVLSLWKRQFLYLVIVAFSAMNAYFNASQDIISRDRETVYSGVVRSEHRYVRHTKLLLHIDRVLFPEDTIACHIKAEYYTFSDESYFGRRLVIRGRIRPSRRALGVPYLSGRIISSRVNSSVSAVILGPVRDYIDRLLHRFYGADRHALAAGLTLGGSGRLRRDLKEVFARAGVLHILAVSGLHVGFAAAFIAALLFFTPLDHRAKFLIVVCALLGYAGVTGFRPSVVRATAMASLAGLAMVSQRKVSAMHTVNITAIAFLVVDPLLLFDVSAQLSFGAVYGIIYLYPRIQAHLIERVRSQVLRIVLRPMAVSLSAQIFVAPLIIHYFHRLPVYAVLANLVIVPAASIAIFMLYISICAGWLWFGLAKAAALAASLPISTLIAVSDLFARLPLSEVRLTISPVIIVPFYLLFWSKPRKMLLWAGLAAAIILTLGKCVDSVEVHSASRLLLITTPASERILLTQRISAQQRAFLEGQGVNEVDYLVAPERDYPVKRGHVQMPAKMRFIDLTVGEVRIRVSDRVRVRFREWEREFTWQELKECSEEGMVMRIASDGEDERVTESALYPTIVAEMRDDALWALSRLILFF